jgi:hypothetical protein
MKRIGSLAILFTLSPQKSGPADNGPKRHALLGGEQSIKLQTGSTHALGRCGSAKRASDLP